MEEALLNPAELAERWGMSKAQLAQQRYLGTGPAFLKINARQVRYRLSDVLAWEQQQTRSQTGVA